jgi:hypothetical protein
VGRLHTNLAARPVDARDHRVPGGLGHHHGNDQPDHQQGAGSHRCPVRDLLGHQDPSPGRQAPLRRQEERRLGRAYECAKRTPTQARVWNSPSDIPALFLFPSRFAASWASAFS